MLGTAVFTCRYHTFIYHGILLFFVDGKINGAYTEVIPLQYRWLQFTDELFISIGASLTPISVMMLVVINFVSLMVHIFSLGYMKGEQRFATYYAFLSLFTFFHAGAGGFHQYF